MCVIYAYHFMSGFFLRGLAGSSACDVKQALLHSDLVLTFIYCREHGVRASSLNSIGESEKNVKVQLAGLLRLRFPCLQNGHQQEIILQL